jgi:hypothetical protein
MKLAIIPPVSRLAEIQNREYHLLLPQLLDTYLDYESFYTYMPKKKDLAQYSTCDKFYILDNGAAEGVEWELRDLLALAYEMRTIDEIVLPDVMGDGEATQARLDEHRNQIRDPLMGYMYVAHGKSAWEVLNRAAYALQHQNITTIGLPRCLFDTVENNEYGIRLRCKLAEEIKETIHHRDVNIHLLGASPLWYEETRLAASSEYIRSMDTSLPYVLASHGYGMYETLIHEIPQGLTRKEGYFDWILDNEDLSKARWNTETMDRWVRNGRA